ncbi:Multicopper oxidase [Phytophthora infestans]|uniref:Multicopper oxidase n=1 Tax=Phytophthora infestans TaxID=4787 RepID=A0A833SNN0_PHYIN|nr:Multicopper oxidase [Phytophthora infestans]KAF4145659.1 Multicopper oxidase [Phytophthora infestans]
MRGSTSAFGDESRRRIQGPTGVQQGSILINSRGRYNCAAAASHGFTQCPEDQPLTPFRIQAGKTYHLRLMFMRALDRFEFSIDGHQLRVIAPDRVSLDPKSTFWWWRRIPWISAPRANAGDGLNADAQAMVYYEEDDVVEPTTKHCNEMSKVGENELTPGTSLRFLRPQTNK